MRLRRTAFTASALVLATAMSATAAPAKKVCNLLVDPAGDWKGGTYSSQASNTVDILSADIATGKGELVAVLRVPTMTTAKGENWRKLGGYGWSMGADLNGVDYKFGYTIGSMFTSDRETTTATVGGAAVPVTLTIGAKELVWKVKRADLASLNKKAGQAFTAIHASTHVWGATADTATAEMGVKYVDKTPSCVAAK